MPGRLVHPVVALFCRHLGTSCDPDFYEPLPMLSRADAFGPEMFARCQVEPDDHAEVVAGRSGIETPRAVTLVFIRQQRVPQVGDALVGLRSVWGEPLVAYPLGAVLAAEHRFVSLGLAQGRRLYRSARVTFRSRSQALAGAVHAS